MIGLDIILAAAVRYPEVMLRCGRALGHELVLPGPGARDIARFAYEFIETHGQPPKEADWDIWLDTMADPRREQCRVVLGRILSVPLGDYTPDYLAEMAATTIRETAARNAVHVLQEAGDAADSDLLIRLAKEVESVRPADISDLADIRDVGRYLSAEEMVAGISTGIPRLDGLLGGWRTELVFVLGDTKAGKSTMLLNMGRAAALDGAHVLHATFELGLRALCTRYYRRLSESGRDAVATNPDTVRDRVQHWFRLASGQIRVLYRPAWTVTPEDFGAMVRAYSARYGSPDVILLDYLDLLERSDKTRRLRTDEALGFAAHYLRGLCGTMECTIISAAQATRPRERQKGSYRDSLSLANMGAAYAKVQAADVVLGLVQTPDEAEVHQGRLQVLATRESPGQGAIIPLLIWRDGMYIGELDHPDSRRLIREHGLRIA